MCTANQQIKCVTQCKASHDGPVVTTEELHKLVDEKKCEKDDNKELHKSLKLILTEVKNTCPLFKQKGLSVDQKVKNLESLIDSQLDFKVLADMGDLESAIIGSEKKEVLVEVQATEEDHTVNDGETSKKKEISKKKETSKKKESSAHSSTPSQELNAIVGEFVLGLFDDGAYPGEVLSIAGDNITMSCLEPAVISVRRNFDFGNPSTIDNQPIEMASVLPILPCLDVSSQLSNRRNVVFELLNFDVVKNFVE